MTRTATARWDSSSRKDSDAVDRRRHRARQQASRRGQRHPRGHDARARPPSRPGAGRGELAAAFLPIPHALYGMTHLAALCRLLPERDPHPQIHAALEEVLDGLIDPRRAGAGVVRFELLLLAELGFGLDLSACAASGTEDDLVYVSPKSGRAVSRQAGEPWKDRLLLLPAFLREAVAGDPSPQDLANGFMLTGFFLARHVLEPRGLSLADARASFIAALEHDARAAIG